MDRPEAGRCERLEPGLRRVLAPNPSPMTLWGTNSYLVGEGEVALIDPGPDLPAHREALLAALAPGERISTILVTHAHRDHSPLAAPLAAATGAEVLAFGSAEAGRSPLMAELAAGGWRAAKEWIPPSAPTAASPTASASRAPAGCSRRSILRAISAAISASPGATAAFRATTRWAGPPRSSLLRTGTWAPMSPPSPSSLPGAGACSIRATARR